MAMQFLVTAGQSITQVLWDLSMEKLEHVKEPSSAMSGSPNFLTFLSSSDRVYTEPGKPGK